jgi:hypothetical protein
MNKIIIFCLCLVLFGCGSAKISAEHDMGVGPASPPKMVYVMDFELNASDIHSGAGLLSSQHEGPLRTALSELRGHENPAARSKELVELMSKSLLKELRKRNLTASRLGASEAMPVDGLLVRGVFVNVEEGNRLRRAVIGFGSGASGLQVVVSVDDLEQGSLKPLYELDTRAGSGKMPGAVITLNPYVAAAKFVFSGRDLDRNIKKTASKIADYIAERTRKQASPSNQNPH